MANASEKPQSIVLAQAGSIGGTIGKPGKSASGGEAVAPPRLRAAPKPRPAKRPVSTDAESRVTRGDSVLNGTWHWTAKCERGQVNYRGTFTFQQSGNTFEAQHGGTNIWDLGTITNGRINGNRVSFTRKWGTYVDQLNLVLSSSGNTLRMSGVIPNTAHSGRCQVVYTKD